ncbi:hypothetical protein MTO96_009187 [Rhipicephalus appendiculatus]
MSENKAFIEIVVGLYLCLTFALLVVDGTVSFIDATNLDRQRRPYIWMTGAFDCFFHVIHLILIVAWASYMYTDNYDGMANVLVGISAHVMGLGLCTTIDIVRKFFMKMVSAKPFLYKAILLFIETLIVSQMDIYQGQMSPVQQATAINADGTVVALPGSYQAPPGTMMLLVVPVQPPEGEAQQQQSTHSMQPLTDDKNKEAARTTSGATDGESDAGTRV